LNFSVKSCSLNSGTERVRGLCEKRKGNVLEKSDTNKSEVEFTVVFKNEAEKEESRRQYIAISGESLKGNKRTLSDKDTGHTLIGDPVTVYRKAVLVCDKPMVLRVPKKGNKMVIHFQSKD